MKENIALFLKYLAECNTLVTFDDVIAMSVEEGITLPEAKVTALRATLEKSLTKTNIEDKLKARLGNRKAQENTGRTFSQVPPSSRAQGSYVPQVTKRDNVHFGRLDNGFVYVAFNPDFNEFTNPEYSQGGNLKLAGIGWTNAKRSPDLEAIGLDSSISLTFQAIRKDDTKQDMRTTQVPVTMTQQERNAFEAWKQDQGK